MTGLPLNIDITQILLHLLNFTVLFAGLYFILYKPVRKIMNEREEHFKKLEEDANGKIEESEKAKEEYESKLKNAKKARDKANSEHDRIISEAQKEIAEIVNEATEKIVLDSNLDTYDEFLNAANKDKGNV